MPFLLPLPDLPRAQEESLALEDAADLGAAIQVCACACLLAALQP